MKKLRITVLMTSLCCLFCSLFAPSVQAQKSTTVKIGYFNDGLVKASYPEAAGAEALKAQAEGQLRRDLEEANKQIQQMQDQKKSSDEIQKAIRDNQISINAKQQALAQLLQTQSQMAREKIQQAVNQVAKDRGLDMVIDGEGVYAGGRTVLDNGVDVTQDIVRKLQPQAATNSAGTDRKKL
jgi:Skp family chaperone for outer membrane proteins